MNLKRGFYTRSKFSGKSLEQTKNRKQRSLNGAPLLFILLLSWSLKEGVVCVARMKRFSALKVISVALIYC